MIFNGLYALTAVQRRLLVSDKQNIFIEKQ